MRRSYGRTGEMRVVVIGSGCTRRVYERRREHGQQRALHKLLIVRPAYGSTSDDLFAEK